MKSVVYLTKYSGDKLPPYYIGSTSEKKALSGEYYGSISSKKYKEIFKKELKENSQLFSIEIISYHDNRKDALKEELRIQIERDVVRSHDYFNMSLATINGYFGMDIKGKKNPMYGKKHSQESIKKIKDNSILYGEDNGFYGKRHSEKTIDKIRKTHLGRKASEKTKKKMRIAHRGKNNSFYGKRHSEKTIKKIKISSFKNDKILRRKIIQYDLQGKFIKEWGSISSAARSLEINCRSIKYVLSGDKKSYKDFIFQYKTNKK